MRTYKLLGLGGVGLLAHMGVAQANALYFGMPVNFDQGETDTIFLYGAPGVTGTITSPNGFNSAYTVGSNGVTSVVIPKTSVTCFIARPLIPVN